MDDQERRELKARYGIAVAAGDTKEAERLKALLDADYETGGRPTETAADAGEPEGAVEVEETAGVYDDYSKDELIAECDRRGLAKSGNKDELVARLEEDDAS